MNRVYEGEFNSWQDVMNGFGDYRKPLKLEEPLYVFAIYDTPSYEGYATVVYSYDGVDFYMVEGSHCSCYGLENQWSPTLHSIEELKKMNTTYAVESSDLKNEYNKWLEMFKPNDTSLSDWV